MKKIALVFPGQGSQYSGMGKKILKNFSLSNQIFEEANDILKRDIKKLCLESSLEILSLTENAQPSIFIISYILYQSFLQEFNLYPSFMAGHSLGEYSALTCSGALSFKDGLQIVSKRAQFMKKAADLQKGAMSAVAGIKKYVIEEVCKKVSRSEKYIVVISNYNSPDQIVISGNKEGIEAANELINNMGGKTFPLKVSGAFHSPLMESAADLLEKELQKYEIKQMSCPVVSNVTAKPYSDGDDIIDLLKRQLIHPVRWEETLKFLRDNGVQKIIEIGPGVVLKRLTLNSLRYVAPFSLDEEDDCHLLKEEILQEKSKIPNLVGKAMGIAVSTQNTNWDNDEYQKGVIAPYQKLKEMALEVEKNNLPVSDEITKKTLDYLLIIFKTKGTPILEQIERINQLFYETLSLNIYNRFKDYVIEKFLPEPILFDEFTKKLMIQKELQKVEV